MTKCNFCYDNIDAGLPPACVAACPMRVLDIVSLTPGSSPTGRGELALWELPASEHPFPLPRYSRTEPHLAIQPHVAMANTLEKTVANREEIKPRKIKSELPLVAFTLLSQMAAGMAVISFFSGPLPTPILVMLGVLIGLAGLASLLHLGAPGNAWRALVHFRKSWLSREILIFAFFGASWLISLVMPGMGKLPLALCGIGLIYSMARVYRLRSVPAWDTNRTQLAFAVSAILLGILGLKVVDFFSNAERIGYPPLVPVAAIGLIITILLSLADRDQAHPPASRLRLGLIGLGMVGVAVLIFVPNTVGDFLAVPLFIIILLEEAIGRFLFYERLSQRIL